MSNSLRPLQLEEAESLALKLAADLSRFCERVEVAGSIRRKEPAVNDIELVCVPKMLDMVDLFGYVVKQESAVSMAALREIFPEGQFIKNGPRYKQIVSKDGVKIDLFLVMPPAQFGVIFMLRTGCGLFSRMMVTRKRYGGWLPNKFAVDSGALRDNFGEIYPTPEEDDFFRLCGYETPLPEERSVIIVDGKKIVRPPKRRPTTSG